MENKTQRNRSKRYPSISLEYAIKVIGDARKFGRNVTSANLGGTGMSSKSGAYIRKKASLGYYGLLSGTGDSLQITDLADKILFAVNNEEKINSLKQSFLSPDLFSNLYQKIEKDTPINLEMLGNVLIRDYGIQPSAKKALLQNFVGSGIYAEVLKYNGENKEEILFLSDKKIAKANEIQGKGDNSNNEAIQAGIGYQTLDLKLENGKGKIIVPEILTRKDAEKLKSMIEVLVNS